ncbi:MAG: hypothetical protein ABGX16_17735 [Pirellulales bacterium]
MNGYPHPARLHLALLTGLLLGSPIHSQGTSTAPMGRSIATFEDIQFWVGQGAKRSALAIDWNGDSSADPAIVWGFRWDGDATGADLLEAIVVADDRLFAKFNFPLGSSSALYGLGYDANGDGLFSLNDGTLFDTVGVAVTSPADGAQSTDPEDTYAEGWLTGFWHYGINDPDHVDENPFENGSWISDGGGMVNRELTDGDWDSWTFTQPISFTQFAANPFAAIGPNLPADFDTDNDVDGMDFLTWQRGFGITADATLAQGDANGDAMVNGLDLHLWQTDVGSMANMAMTSQTAPEPSSLKIALYVLLLYFPVFRRKEKSHEVATRIWFDRDSIRHDI